ncbi:helix-turn-helix domain-containing protein [Planococcus rifietoensis]|uniref:helix-turn-helix domain-containing protein n=1 Tax=Planococcus rifietoensis TaxID=200991 RepID=UPI00384C8E99
MKDGALLKYHRKKRGLNQEQVAEGIVSTSYYSKIENDLVEPAPETYNLLFEKLGLERTNAEIENRKFIKLLMDWEKPLLFNNLEEATLIKEKLENLLIKVIEVDLLLEYQVKLVRFCIIAKQLSDIKKLIIVLAELTEKFNLRTSFFYYKHLGNFFYATGDYTRADEHLAISVSLYNSNHFSELEKADTHYLYSLVLSNLRNDYNSLSFAESSLAVFRDHYRLESCAKAHIQIGIGNSRLLNTDVALKHYNLAKNLSQERKDYKILGIIEHNIASLLHRQREIGAAIKHLKISLDYKKKFYDSSYFTTLILLITYNYEQNEISACKKWIEEGIILLNKVEASKIQELEIEFYRQFILDNDSDWELFCTKTFFVFLKENKKWNHLTTYSKIIGNYFNKKMLYKKSALYFQEAIIGHENIHVR